MGKILAGDRLGDAEGPSCRCPKGKERQGEHSEETFIISDKDVFECPICCEPLSIPVFQCENGHIACSFCCSRIKKKCPSCSSSCGYSRNRAIEKILELVQARCNNTKYGCKETLMGFSKKHDHEKICQYAPCACPLCNFLGSSSHLYQHFSHEHNSSSVYFQYNKLLKVTLKESRNFLVLQEEQNDDIFILHNTSTEGGRLISVSHIGSSQEKEFPYLITERYEYSSIIFNHFAKSIRSYRDYDPSIGFFLHPQDFDSRGNRNLEILIFRNVRETESYDEEDEVEEEDEWDEDSGEAENYEDEEEEEEEEESDETGDDDEEEVDSVDEEAGSNNGTISVTLTDPEVLDCPICYIPLTSPVFQCENGHVACSSCCTKLVNKCPTCCSKTGYRNRAIEKVLETSKVLCKFAKYGCKQTVNYSKIRDHEKNCFHVPCFCPLASCNFIGLSNQLYQHFSNKHKNSAVQFLFNIRFFITLNVNDKYHILREEKDGILFILHNSKITEHHGNAISITCIASRNIGPSIPYDISVIMSELYALKFECLSTVKSRKWDDHKPSTGFLVVPAYFFNSDGQLKLDVRIFRSRAAARFIKVK